MKRIITVALFAALSITAAHADEFTDGCAVDLTCCEGDACDEVMAGCIDAQDSALANKLQALARAMRQLEQNADFVCPEASDDGDDGDEVDPDKYDMSDAKW